MIVSAFNPTVDDLETTYLAQSYTLGVTSVEVKNNQEFGANQRIQIGASGLASTEIVTTGTPNANGTTLPISATLFPHEADAPVYLLQFDQVQFYLSTTGINGTYTLLATQNLDVTNENLQTNYNDLTSVSGYYYEIAMYNSISTVTSAFSDPIPAVTGWARNQVGHLVDEILEEINDKTEQNISRSELIGYFNEVNDDLLLQVAKPYKFQMKREVFSRVAGANSLAYPTDMWKFSHMDYNYVDNTTSPVTNTTYTVETVPLTYFRNRHLSNENDSTTQNDTVQEMCLNDFTQQFDYYPASLTSSTAVWYCYYWVELSELASEGDVLITPTPRIYKLYAMYKYYLKRSVTEPAYMANSQEFNKQYTMEKIRYKSQDRTDQGTPRRFESEGWVRKSFRR